MENQAVAYVDGSCCPTNPGPGGWAFIYLDGQREWHVSGGETTSTNNKMELTAAIEALEFVPKEKKLTIYSDSIYVIKGITEWIGNWKKKGWAKVKNREYWERLDGLCEGRSVEWRWVKAHNGDVYNEKVDKLARSWAKRMSRL